MVLICFYYYFSPFARTHYIRGIWRLLFHSPPPWQNKTLVFPKHLFSGRWGGGEQELQGISPKKGLAPYFCSLPTDSGVVQSSCTFSSCWSGAAMASPEGPFPAPAQSGGHFCSCHPPNPLSLRQNMRKTNPFRHIGFASMFITDAPLPPPPRGSLLGALTLW